MEKIDNKRRVNRYKYLVYFYGLFVVCVIFYKFLFLPEAANLILLSALVPLFGFMPIFFNWPVYVQAMDTDEGVMIHTRRLFSKEKHSLLLNSYNFDSYFKTDPLHIGLQALDDNDKLKQHKIKISWMRLKDVQALEEKLREINPYARLQ